MDWYIRKPQPAVPAIQWDGRNETFEKMRHQAGEKFEPYLVVYYTTQGVHMNIMTPERDDIVRPGDWVLFTDDGPFVSRKDVFEKWYERAEVHA